jgi:O-antigen/teichoic acid export membrane protein
MTTPRSLTRLLHFFGTGIIDQMMLSGANFLVGLGMIRYTNAVDYGQFVLVQSAILLLTSAQSAWLAPLCAILPAKPPDLRRTIVGAVEASQSRILRILVILALTADLIGYLMGACGGVAAIVMGAGVLAGWAALQREYVRSILVIYARPQSMLRADVLYVSMLLALVAFAVFGTGFHSIGAVIALVAAGWAGWAGAHRSLGADPGWVRGNLAPYWREVQPLAIWSTTGAVTYWLLGQSYNYLLATRLNFTAVLNINAARLLMMPVIVFTLGINNLLLPVAANWLHEFGLRQLVRRLAVLTLGLLALDSVYFAFAWTFRDWLISDLLHKTIADRDLLLFLWACVSVISLLREVLQAALFAMKRMKHMAWLIALSAVVSLMISWFGVSHWGVAAALIGQISGECVNLGGLALLLRRQIKLQTASPSTSKHVR